MKANYKRLAAYYRKRFLEEGRDAAAFHALYALAEDKIAKQDEEIKCLRERIAQWEAEQWIKSQTV